MIRKTNEVRGDSVVTDEKILKNEEAAIFNLRSLYRSYGYKPFKMKKFEEYDLYVNNKSFLVSDRIITFTDKDGKLLALKPDVTLSIIKSTEDIVGEKQKVYYNENVYRASKRTSHFEEILQTGIECIGDIDVADISEVILLAAKSLEKISSDFIIDISHMGILNDILSSISTDETFRSKSLLLISEKNSHELLSLSREYSLTNEKEKQLLMLASARADINSILELCKDKFANKGYLEMKAIADVLSKTEFYDKIRFDFSLVSDMNYYDGVVFKGFVFGISSSVLSGGEYGKLLKGMKKKSGGVGFAIYLDALEELSVPSEEYDFDALLLASRNTDNSEIFAEKERLISLGKSVYFSRAIPKKLRFKEIIRLGKTDD